MNFETATINLLTIEEGRKYMIPALKESVNFGMGIRPVIHFGEDLKQDAGDTFQFGGHTFTILDKSLAICNDCIGETNGKEADIRQILDDWFEKNRSSYLSNEEFEKLEKDAFCVPSPTGMDFMEYIQKNHLEGMDYKEIVKAFEGQKTDMEQPISSYKDALRFDFHKPANLETQNFLDVHADELCGNGTKFFALARNDRQCVSFFMNVSSMKTVCERLQGEKADLFTMGLLNMDRKTGQLLRVEAEYAAHDFWNWDMYCYLVKTELGRREMKLPIPLSPEEKKSLEDAVLSGVEELAMENVKVEEEMEEER